MLKCMTTHCITDLIGLTAGSAGEGIRRTAIPAETYGVGVLSEVASISGGATDRNEPVREQEYFCHAGELGSSEPFSRRVRWPRARLGSLKRGGSGTMVGE